MFCFFFFFKQKTAYEMRISDWSSDVCSSDLPADAQELALAEIAADLHAGDALERFGDVLLGIFADVLGRDAVADDIEIALVFDRALKAGRETGDDDLFAGGVLIVRCHRRIVALIARILCS